MAQPTLIELAKQGNLDAITHLINRSLQSQNATAKLMRHESCLKILLEGAEVPPSSLAKSLQIGLEKLSIPLIDRLEIHGKQANSNAISWTKTVQLTPFPESSFSRLPALPDEAEVITKTRAGIYPEKNCPRPYFALALLTTVLAFLPLGIAALFFSRQVKPHHARQDYEGAKAASETAKILCIVGICLASPFYLAIGFFATSYSILTAAYEKQTSSLYELQAKTTIEAINRSQQAYWLENKQFAASLDQLQLPLQSANPYQYQVIASEPDRAIVTAIPTKPEFKSFTGIVSAIPASPDAQPNGFVKITPLQSTICTTENPVTPAQIQIEGDRIICPSEKL